MKLLDTQITFTIKDVLCTIFSIGGMIALFYIILFLRELYKMFRDYNALYSENKENITTIINESSQMIKKSNNIMNVFSSDIKNASGEMNELFSTIKIAFSFLKPFFTKK